MALGDLQLQAEPITFTIIITKYVESSAQM